MRVIAAVLAVTAASVAAVRAEEADSPWVCALCEAGVKRVEGLLPVNATENDVEALLKDACTLGHILPKWLDPLSQMCVDFVNCELDILADDILKLTAPQQVCEDVGLCSANLTSVLRASKAVQGGKCTPWCGLCEGAVNWAYGELDGKNTTKEIDSVLDGICDLPIVPKDVRLECKLLVDREWIKIRDHIQQKDSAQVICTDIHMCDAQRSYYVQKA